MAILLLSITTIQATFDKPDYGKSFFLPPTLTAPADGATDVQLSVTFTGSRWTNATFEIYEDNTFDKSDSINLIGYTPVPGYPKTIPSVDNDVSGIAWNPNVPDSLFMINNNPTEIYVTDLEGRNARKVTLPGFDDTEDIVHISGNTFAIVEEKIHRISYIKITPNISSVSPGDAIRSFKLDITLPSPNKGLEGVSYDAVNNMLYAISERPLRVYRWSAAISGTIVPEAFDVPASFGMSDQSAIYHLSQAQGFDNLNVSNHFLLLSDENHKIVETDINFDDYGSKILPRLDEGITIPRTDRDFTKFEGITIGNQGDIYLVSEENFLYKYSNKNCNRSLIPTGDLVHSETLNENSYSLPTGLLEAEKTYSWRVITSDGQCSDFWSFTTARPDCNIIVAPEIVSACNDNDTPTDSTDDTFTITVTATVTNGSGFYIVNDGNKTYLPTPSGTPVALGPYPTDGSTDVQLTYSDSADPTCNTNTLPIGPVDHCSNQCSIIVDPEIVSACNDNGTPTDLTDDTFTITVKATVINGSGFYIVRDNHGNSFTVASGASLTLNPYLADGSTDVRLTYLDSVNPTCKINTLPIGPVDPCRCSSVINAVITDGNNDVEENGRTGYIYFNSSDLEMFSETRRGNQVIGLRYTDVTLPQDVLICKAYIQFTVANGKNIPGEWRIYAEDSPASAPFSNTKRNVSSRPRTNGFLWQPLIWDTVGASGSDQQTVDISTAIQQVVDKQDWDGTITIILEGEGRRVAESFEGSPSKAPVLHIEFESTTNSF